MQLAACGRRTTGRRDFSALLHAIGGRQGDVIFRCGVCGEGRLANVRASHGRKADCGFGAVVCGEGRFANVRVGATVCGKGRFANQLGRRSAVKGDLRSFERAMHGRLIADSERSGGDTMGVDSV